MSAPALNVLPHPTADPVRDVIEGLRILADAIESREYGDVHNVAWIVDTDEGHLECGLFGLSAGKPSAAYFLLGRAQRFLEGGAIAP